MEDSVDLIRTDFPMVPAKHVGELLAEHDHSLFSTYLDLYRIISAWHDRPLKPWDLRFAPRDVPRPDPDLPISETALQVYALPLDDATEALLREINAARTVCRARQPDEATLANLAKDTELSMGVGTTADMQFEDDEQIECQCCFDDFAVASLVHCNGEFVHVSTPDERMHVQSGIC